MDRCEASVPASTYRRAGRCELTRGVKKVERTGTWKIKTAELCSCHRAMFLSGKLKLHKESRP